MYISREAMKLQNDACKDVEDVNKKTEKNQKREKNLKNLACKKTSKNQP